MIKPMLVIAFIMMSFSTVNAQSTADSDKHSPVRTLSYEQYEAYLKGEADNNMAMVAEINHFPLPDQVLKFKKELDLSPLQLKKVNAINDYMHRRRVQTGESIVRNERTLDSLFRYHKMDEGNLIFYTNRHGLYQGELKNAILFACLATQKELTPQQLAKFEALKKAN
jgi:hypothetical protein